MQLTDIQEDLFKEVFNIGVGRAAQALSELAGGDEIKLSVPEVKMMDVQELERLVTKNSGDKVCGVSEAFSGSFEGRAIMLYSQAESLTLISLMLGGIVPIEQISEMESEALSEVGNIVLNACLSGMADSFGIEIETEVPQFHKGSFLKVFAENNAQSHNEILYLRIDFQLASHKLSGHLGFLLDFQAVAMLAKCLDDYLGKMLQP